jgi:hypothetical protein
MEDVVLGEVRPEFCVIFQSDRLVTDTSQAAPWRGLDPPSPCPFASSALEVAKELGVATRRPL